MLLIASSMSAFADNKDVVVTNPPNVSDYAPVRIVLDGAKGNSCLAEAQHLKDELRSLQFPPGWTLGIMCTRVRWEQLLQQADVHTTHAAFTRIAERLTVFNVEIFHDYEYNYRHIIAHELAHIKCNCASEATAEKIARDLERMATEKQRVEAVSSPVGQQPSRQSAGQQAKAGGE